MLSSEFRHESPEVVHGLKPVATLESPAQAKAGLKKFEPDCDAETVADLFSEQLTQGGASLQDSKNIDPDFDTDPDADLFSEQLTQGGASLENDENADLGSGSLMTILVYNLLKH